MIGGGGFALHSGPAPCWQLCTPDALCDASCLPHIPSLPAHATARTQAEDEPLSIGGLQATPAAEASLRRCWQALGQRSLYREQYEQYRELVAQVLSRDIRSVTQRIKVPQRAQQGGAAALGAHAAAAAPQQQQHGEPGVAAAATEEEEGWWKVVLDGIQLSYDVVEGVEGLDGGGGKEGGADGDSSRNRVLLRSATLLES